MDTLHLTFQFKSIFKSFDSFAFQMKILLICLILFVAATKGKVAYFYFSIVSGGGGAPRQNERRVCAVAKGVIFKIAEMHCKDGLFDKCTEDEKAEESDRVMNE